MKNKNKKKKKKSKKDKKEGENEEVSGKEESVEPADQLKDETDETVNKEEATTEADKVDEAKPVVEETIEKEEPKGEPEESVEQGVAEDAKEETTQEKETEATTESSEAPVDKEEKLAEKLEALAVDEQDVEEKTAGAGQATEDPVDDLFPDSGPSFMESIKQSQADEALLKVQQENQSLKEEVAKLKADNKSLKILKLDHLDQIETLEAKVADLESKLARAKVDSSHNNTLTASAYDQDDNLSLSPTPSFQQSFPTSFSQFNSHNKNESQLSITEIKARLNKWKNWNIDMTNWRSVGSGPIVEL